jgi:CheY-like chemotaxis protein
MLSELKRVLLADDNEFMLSVLKEHLHSIFPRARIDFGRDGQELHDLITSSDRPYDVIISDDNMPKRSGLQTLLELKGAGYLAATRVIVTSGTLTLRPERVETARENGFYVLHKPCSLDAITQAIGERAEPRYEPSIPAYTLVGVAA